MGRFPTMVESIDDAAWLPVQYCPAKHIDLHAIEGRGDVTGRRRVGLDVIEIDVHVSQDGLVRLEFIN